MAGPDDLGAGGPPLVITTEEDGIAVSVGQDQPIAVAAFDEVGGERAPGAQPAADMTPVRFVACRRTEGRRLAVRRLAVRRLDGGRSVKEQHGVTEAAAPGVQDQVDGAAASGPGEMIEEA